VHHGTDHSFHFNSGLRHRDEDAMGWRGAWLTACRDPHGKLRCKLR
jgi:hypothetical protein